MKYLTKILNADIPLPSHQHIQRWRYANTKNSEELPLMIDNSLSLAACGDWQQAGRVEGAFISGLRTATEFIKE